MRPFVRHLGVPFRSRSVAPTVLLVLGLVAPLLGPAGVAGQDGAVLYAAGDIADCEEKADKATARLLGKDGRVLALGDDAYDAGTLREFKRCYGPTWGKFKASTLPVPGNHEYETKRADGYFDYFGDRAGDRRQGYYAVDYGGWRLIALNSNCGKIGGCDADSPQGRWLTDQLATAPPCTLAFWHHPRFSSGRTHGSYSKVQPLWQQLADGGADVVLSGHEHNYERFAPMDAAGNADTDGIRLFVVGTGGADLYGFGRPLPTSEVRNAHAHGVLKLTLRSDGYDWTFVPVRSKAFRDAGSGSCR